MAGQLNESINLFNTAMANRRKLAQDRQNSDLDRALKLAELQSKGFTVSEQQTPRKLLGFIPAGSQRSLSFNYDPSMNPDYLSKLREGEKLNLEIDKLRREEQEAKDVRSLIFGDDSSSPSQSDPLSSSVASSGPTAQPVVASGQTSDKTNKRPVMKQIKYGGQTFENPAYAEYEAQQAAEAARKKKQSEWDVKRLDVKRRLENIYKLSDQVPRGSGFAFDVIPKRFLTGARTEFEKFGQSTPRGIAAGQLEDSAKDILAPLARLAGDVGNLAEWEQKIRLNLIPSQWDSPERTELKKAYLNELSRIVDNENATPNEIDAFFEKIGAGTKTEKQGGQIMVDADGNRAMVYQDGTIEEL